MTPARPADPEVEALVDALITAAYQNGIAETGGMAGALTIDGTRYETDAARTALLSAVRSIRRQAMEEAARVVENMGDCAACDLAAEIRALTPGADDGGGANEGNDRGGHR